MLVRRAALTLRLGATLFFFAAIALFIKPGDVATFFGFASKTLTPELLGSLRIMGATFLIPALLGPVVAAFAGGERAAPGCGRNGLYLSWYRHDDAFHPRHMGMGQDLLCWDQLSLCADVLLRAARTWP